MLYLAIFINFFNDHICNKLSNPTKPNKSLSSCLVFNQQVAAVLYEYCAVFTVRPITVVMQPTSSTLLIQTPFSSAFRGDAVPFL